MSTKKRKRRETNQSKTPGKDRGRRRVSTQSLKRKGYWKITIDKIHAKNLPRSSLYGFGKANPYLIFLWDDKSKLQTEVVKNSHDAQFSSSFTFEYQLSNCEELKNRFLTVEVMDHSALKSDSILGYVTLDLFLLATGPVTHDVAIQKIDKKNKSSRAKEHGFTTRGRLNFSVTMKCISTIDVSLSNVSCSQLRPGNKHHFAEWENDSHLEIYFKDHPDARRLTPICYNTNNPSWLRIAPLPFTATLRSLLKQTIVVEVYNDCEGAKELLGTSSLSLSSCYSLREEPVHFTEAFEFKDTKFGYIEGQMTLRDLPPLAQMEDGLHCDTKIMQASPIVVGAVTPDKKIYKLRLNAPVFKRPDSILNGLAKTAHVSLEIRQMQQKIKKIADSIRKKTRPRASRSQSSINPLSLLKQLNEMTESDPKNAATICHDNGILRLVVPMLRTDEPKLQDEVIRLLLSVCKSDSNCLAELENRDGLTLLLKLLKRPDKYVPQKKILEILSLLSIRDSLIQSKFRTTGLIPVLLAVLQRSKGSSAKHLVLQILGNLSYGRAGEIKSNKDVIRYSGGIPILLDLLHYQRFSKAVLHTLKQIAHKNSENQKAIAVDITDHLVQHFDTGDANDNTTLVLLQVISQFIPVKSEEANIVLEKASKILISISSSTTEAVADKAMFLLKAYRTSESEQHLVADILDTIKRKDSRKEIHVALRMLKNLLEDNQENLDKISALLVDNNSQLTSLLSVLETEDPIDIGLGLRCINILSQDSDALCLEIYKHGDKELLRRLVSLLASEDQNIQQNCLSLILNIATDEQTHGELCKADVFEALSALLKKSESIIVTQTSLKLVAKLTSNSPVSRKLMLSKQIPVIQFVEYLTHEAEVVYHAVRIIHNLCFPIIPDTKQILENIIITNTVTTLFSIVSNPSLLTPKPQPVVQAALAAIGDLVTEDDVRESINEKQAVKKLQKMANDPIIGPAARNCLKAFSSATALLEFPEDFICPISQEPFQDPVMTCDGHSYEREMIEDWLSGHDLSPLTGETLPSKVLIPNITLRKAVQEFLHKYPELADNA